jgi:hypothetical protein
MLHVQLLHSCPHSLCIGWHLLPAGAVDAATTMVRTAGVTSLYKGLALNSSSETLDTPETQIN